MKKIFLFLFSFTLVLSLDQSVSGDKPMALESLEYSLSILTMPFYLVTSPMVSFETSKENNDENIIVKNQYKYFEKLMAQKNFRNIQAKEIFNHNYIELLSLKEDDEINLDKTSIGILISTSDRNLFLVVSDVKYKGFSNRRIR